MLVKFTTSLRNFNATDIIIDGRGLVAYEVPSSPLCDMRGAALFLFFNGRPFEDFTFETPQVERAVRVAYEYMRNPKELHKRIAEKSIRPARASVINVGTGKPL